MDEDEIIQAWLEGVPPQFKRGEGLQDEIGEFVHNFIKQERHGNWTRDNLDTALGCYIASSSKHDSHYDSRNWQPGPDFYKYTPYEFEHPPGWHELMNEVARSVGSSHSVTAEDCVLLWGMGIRVDDDMADPK